MEREERRGEEEGRGEGEGKGKGEGSGVEGVTLLQAAAVMLPS